jgi:hypothetical protein
MARRLPGRAAAGVSPGPPLSKDTPVNFLPAHRPARLAVILLAAITAIVTNTLTAAPDPEESK